MTTRVATCRCGQLSAVCTGEPFRISACHCLDCQKRTGGVFSIQARWPHSDVVSTGEFASWTHITDGGSRTEFRFCPNCGSTLSYTNEDMPGLVAIPVGAFADPNFPAPHYSVFEERKHKWVELTDDQIERFD